MMKKLFSIALIVIAFCMTLEAQKLQLNITYDQGIYCGRTYTGIQAIEEDFLKDKPRYESEFFESFLETYRGVAYAPDEIDAEQPLLQVCIENVTAKGDVTATLNYITATEVKTRTVKGRGGVFGTWLNLFGDGMESLGKIAAQWLNTMPVRR